MNFKKKLGMGIMTAILALGLIGGGTFAYFSDTTEQTNTFASGVMDLSVNPEVSVDVDNLKPGDWMPRTFKLHNDGTLAMKYVSLTTEYSVTQNNGEPVSNGLANDYADSINVQFLKNTSGDKPYKVIAELSLLELRDMTPEDLATKINKEWELVWPFPPIYWPKDKEFTGLGVGETANFAVKFVFEETGEDQNHLQDLNLDLRWTFEGFQEDGERR